MAVTVQPYQSFLTLVGSGTINLSSHTFKIILVEGYSFDAAHDELADVIASEIPDGTGYTANGHTLVGVTWGYDAGNEQWKWDADNLLLTASGGSIGPASGAIIYDDTASGDKLCFYIDFGAEEEAEDQVQFLITFNADGLMNLSIS